MKVKGFIKASSSELRAFRYDEVMATSFIRHWNHKRSVHTAGYALAEVMMAIILLGVLTGVMTQMMTNTRNDMKATADKADALEFENRVINSTFEEAKCAALVGLGNGIEVAKAAVDAAGATGVTVPLASILVDGQVRNVNDSITPGGLTLTSAGLKFVPQGTDYMVSLDYVLSKANQNQLGAQRFTKSISLNTSTTLNGANVKLLSCKGDRSAQQSCSQLGGRWLRGPKAGFTGTTDPDRFPNDPNYANHFMDQERCEMAGELKLTIREAPVGVPIMGGQNAEGERIEECYYNSGATASVVKTYLCPSGSGTKRGYRCVYNRGSQQWQVRYFASGGDWNTSIQKKVCDRGVKVSTKSPTTVILDFNEPLWNAWEGTSAPTTVAAEDAFYWDHLQAVESCTLNPNDDSPKKCINPNDPVGALRAGKGACVFVKNSKPLGSAGLLGSFSALVGGPLAPNSEFSGGWIWVHGSYTGAATTGGTSNLRGRLRNPRGYPCHSVTVNSSLISDDAPPTLVTTPPSTASALLDLKSAPDRVSECVYQAGDKLTGTGNAPNYRRKLIYTCDNSDLTPDDGVAPSELDYWTGLTTELYDHDEDGCEAPADCPKGNPATWIDGTFPWPAGTAAADQYTGTKGRTSPQLKRGTCWYFDKVQIATYATGTASDSGLAGANFIWSGANVIQGDGGETDGDYDWLRTKVYTGWVWLSGALPDGKYRTMPGTQILQDIGRGGDSSKPVSVIPGIPCTGGVRVESP